MKIKLPYMGKIAGLALIQSSVSAVGLLITCIVWNKWQSCHKETRDGFVIYRTGLWEKCVDNYVQRIKVCTLISSETVELKCVNVLVVLSMSLQILAIILGLIIRRYEKQQSVIAVPILFNFASALCGTVGLVLYSVIYDKENCHLSASYVMGCVGVIEAFLSCFLFILISFGKFWLLSPPKETGYEEPSPNDNGLGNIVFVSCPTLFSDSSN